MKMGSKSKTQNRILEISWVISRIIILLIIQLGIDAFYKVGWFQVLGSQEIQRLVLDVLKKIVLTFYLWFFYSFFKKFVLPLFTSMSRPIVEKIVTDTNMKEKQVSMVNRYFMILANIIAILAFINIWAYSYVGVWLAGTMGTGLIITLTFVLGLFTSSVLGNILGYWVISNVLEFEVGD
jgi:hypothetical protein